MAEEDYLDSIQRIVARIFELPADEVSYDMPINRLKGWDSILQLTLVIEIEDEIGYPLTPDELTRCLSVRDFARVLDQRAEERRH